MDIVVYIIIAIVVPLTEGLTKRNDFEYRLRKNLFANYTKGCQPVRPIKVKLGVALSNLMSMDVQKEEVSLNIWLRLTWDDTRLKWKPAEYNNITQIRVLMQDIWTPDVFLYFATGSIQEFGKSIKGSLKFGSSLDNNGVLFFSQPTTIHASCEVDIANYPFDDQICELTFGTWSHDLSQVDIHLYKTGVDQSMYSKHNEWEILSADATRRVMFDASFKEGYSRAVLKLHLRRNALFYLINYVLPSVIIAVLSLLVFLIPPEVGKRMEAGINLLLCLSVYLMLVNSKMPITSKSFPLLTKFYGCTIVILVISLCCSCWVYSFYFMNPSGWDVYHIPRWLQVILFGYLYPILYWSPSCKTSKQSNESTSEMYFENIPLDENRETSSSSGHKTQQHHSKAMNDQPLTEEMVTVKEQAGKYTGEENDSGNLERKQNGNNSQSKGKSLSGDPMKPVPFVRGNVFFIKSKEDVTEEENNDATNENTADNTKENDVEAFGHNTVSVPETTNVTKEAEPVRPRLPPIQNPHLLYMAEAAQMDNQKLLNKEKWKSAAMILNRFFIILLIISITSSFLGCFMSSPRITKD